MKTVVIGVTGSIAAYKVGDLIQSLKDKDIAVFVIMTEAATKIVDPKVFEKASGNIVYTKLFPEDFDYKKILKEKKVDHIDLANKAGVMVIAPATANTIAKLAHGLADNFLTTTALAHSLPLIICPAMNVQMWNNPITQKNITILKHQGHTILEPTVGMLACGYEGKGKLENIAVIKEKILQKMRATYTSKEHV